MSDDSKLMSLLAGFLLASLGLIFGAGWLAHAGIYWAAFLCGIFGGASVLLACLFGLFIFG